MKRLTKNFLKSFGTIIVLSLLGMSCNKDFPNRLQDNIKQPDYNTGSSKVLFVMVDGLSGNNLQEIEPPTLYKMSRNALYTYSSLTDFVEEPLTQERAWTNVFLGVDANKHQGKTNIDEVDFDSYPTFISRVKELNNQISISGFTSEQKVYDNFLSESDQADLVTEDQEVFEKTLTEIKESNTDLIISHFTKINEIGTATDYDASNADYLAAITQLDDYLKGLLEAIEGRETYEQEDWLIIVASTTGGGTVIDPEDQTQFGKENRNTFTFFYSPKFTRKYLAKPTSANLPFKGDALNFKYSEQNRAILDSDRTVGNLESGKSYTISFLYRSYKTSGNLNWTAILGKRASADNNGGGSGWSMFHADNSLSFVSNLGDSQNSEVNIRDGEWHSVTVVIDRDNQKVINYVDGIPATQTDGYKNEAASNDLPLTLGYIPSYTPGAESTDYLLSNFQFYERAFTPEDVEELSGLVNIDDTHPYFDDLQGYWPGFGDVGTDTLRDMSGHGRDMVVKGDVYWNSFNNIVSFIRPDISSDFYQQVPNGVDLSFFIYQWFGVIPSKDWSLDGKSWTPDYSVNNE